MGGGGETRTGWLSTTKRGSISHTICNTTLACSLSVAVYTIVLESWSCSSQRPPYMVIGGPSGIGCPQSPLECADCPTGPTALINHLAYRTIKGVSNVARKGPRMHGPLLFSCSIPSCMQGCIMSTMMASKGEVVLAI